MTNLKIEGLKESNLGKREDRFLLRKLRPVCDGKLEVLMGIRSIVDGAAFTASKNPLGLRLHAYARIEEWATQFPPRIKPPLARRRTFIEVVLKGF